MKKISISLLLILLLFFTACGGGAKKAKNAKGLDEKEIQAKLEAFAQQVIAHFQRQDAIAAYMAQRQAASDRLLEIALDAKTRRIPDPRFIELATNTIIDYGKVAQTLLSPEEWGAIGGNFANFASANPAFGGLAGQIPGFGSGVPGFSPSGSPFSGFAGGPSFGGGPFGGSFGGSPFDGSSAFPGATPGEIYPGVLGSLPHI